MSTIPPAPAPARPSKRPILVVDDEPEILFSLKNLLRREFEVHTASSGAEGIDILEHNVIHLVMTDQRMPEMTGVELLRKVKSEHPGAMRLIFTGYADVKAIIDAINQGNVFRFVTKPWDPDELLKVLREAGHRYDQIVERLSLLKRLQDFEARAMQFKDGLLSGELGTLTPVGCDEGWELVRSNRELNECLDRVLREMTNEPMT
jgi:DNA-binding NtrC family response regulator